ncbi:MAG: hypothetical protein H0Z30_06450 [Candidatus Marinimicrobia bacterium]|nr:hypothetical protein [Candidatus Neomarinimicrobiota bacterium]
MIGIREIKRLTDERLIEVRRIVEGDRVGLIEGIEEEGSLRVSFEGVPQFKKTVILDFFILDYCKMFPQSVYHVPESDSLMYH